jgi:hypothetical protein
MDICKARAISSIHVLSSIFYFFKPENLTKGDDVKTRGKQLLQFEITQVKLQNWKT